MKRSANVLLLALAGYAGTAVAGPILWTIDGDCADCHAAFAGGGTLSGSFVFDADTGMYSSVSLVTTSGTDVVAADYIFSQGTLSSSKTLFAVTSNAADLSGTTTVDL